MIKHCRWIYLRVFAPTALGIHTFSEHPNKIIDCSTLKETVTGCRMTEHRMTKGRKNECRMTEGRMSEGRK